MTVDTSFVCIELVYLGYMTQNYIELRYMINDTDPTSMQLLAHHKMVIPGVFVGIWAGYSSPGISNVACLCEISAIFLNYRSMWSKDLMNDTLPSINNTIFFLSYLVFRVVMFPLCWYCLIKNTQWTWHLQTWDRKFGGVLGITLYLIVIGLNLYWFALIVKGMKRMLEEKGVLKKKEVTINDEAYMFGFDKKTS
jgi:hypothetical protein